MAVVLVVIIVHRLKSYTSEALNLITTPLSEVAFGLHYDLAFCIELVGVSEIFIFGSNKGFKQHLLTGRAARFKDRIEDGHKVCHVLFEKFAKGDGDKLRMIVSSDVRNFEVLRQ